MKSVKVKITYQSIPSIKRTNIMNITFLEASVPLTKAFTPTTKTSYPSAFEFTSHTEHITTLESLFKSIKKHSSQGHCLLKGELTRPLIKESRAKSTDSMIETEWLCLDFDGLPLGTDLNTLLDKVPEFSDVDYIVQASASMGIIGQPQLYKGHVFLLADTPVAPATLKHRLTQLNLTIDTLADSLRLTKTNNALSYVLDPTVAQNDKLIYIAPPQCTPDSIDTLKGQRIQLVKRGRTHAKISPHNLNSPEVLKSLIESKINQLRSAASLPPRKKFTYMTDTKTGINYLAKPDKCLVTGTKIERDFVYLNLNGGDSWAYYHPQDNATFLYNFKDEPTYKLSEIAPEYYAQAKVHADNVAKMANTAAKTVTQNVNVTGTDPVYLVFRDMKTSLYYNGIYDPITETWNLARAGSEKMLADFMAQYGQPEPEVIPIWNIIFNPNKAPIDPVKKEVNLYTESKVLKEARALKQQEGVDSIVPTTIQKVIWHVVGGDQETYDHFINWLAFIVQTKQRAQTAWLFKGVQGTGKGTMIHKILRPMLGEMNTTFMEAYQLEERFNESIEHSIMTCIDELSIEDFEGGSKILGMMKSLITEPHITIRKMRTAPYLTENFNNFIGFANTNQLVRIEQTDRRYNQGYYQTKQIELSDEEINIDIPSELVAFASYLWTYAADSKKARKVLNSAARSEVQDMSVNSIDKIAHAINQGDLEELHSYIVEINQAQGKTMNTAPMYRDLLYSIFMFDYKTLSREELGIIFSHCVGDVPTSPTKFSRFLNHHDIKIISVSRGTQVFRGIKVDWNCDIKWYDKTKQSIIAERTPKLKVVPKEDLKDISF